jgi:hypothetical protein
VYWLFFFTIAVAASMLELCCGEEGGIPRLFENVRTITRITKFVFHPTSSLSVANIIREASERGITWWASY